MRRFSLWSPPTALLCQHSTMWHLIRTCQKTSTRPCCRLKEATWSQMECLIWWNRRLLQSLIEPTKLLLLWTKLRYVLLRQIFCLCDRPFFKCLGWTSKVPNSSIKLVFTTQQGIQWSPWRMGETSALESLYGGQINYQLNWLKTLLSCDNRIIAAPQFL